MFHVLRVCCRGLEDLGWWAPFLEEAVGNVAKTEANGYVGLLRGELSLMRGGVEIPTPLPIPCRDVFEQSFPT